jgi:apolipoprotein N-acyltransferase
MTVARRWRACGLVGLGGLILSGAWLSLGVEPLLPLAAAAIILGFRHVESWRDALWCSLAGAISYHGICAYGVFDLVRYSWLAVLFHPMVVGYALISWVALFLGGLALERLVGVPRAAGLILLWPLLERLRTISDLSLPVDLLAHSFGTQPAWLAWTPWIGPFGFALLVWLVGGLLVVAWDRRPEWRRALLPAGVGIALWVAQPVTGVALTAPSSPQTGELLRVAMIQPCVDVRDKLDRTRWPALWERLQRLTRSAAGGDVDLIVWPETTRPGPIIWKEGTAIDDAPVRELAEEIGVPILYGCEIAKVRGRQVLGMYNGAAMVRPDGAPLEWYGKQRLLPFIEGVPFRGLFGSSEPSGSGGSGRSSLLTLMGNFRPGPQPTVFEVDSARLGLLVCYEAIYPSLGRRCRGAGANTLLVITNDAWWDGNAFAHWHARIVAIQARSLGVPILRAANNGITSVTDANGRRQVTAEMDEITVLEAGVTPGRAPGTLYARYGDGVLLALLSMGAVVVGIARWRGRLPARVSDGSERSSAPRG